MKQLTDRIRARQQKPYSDDGFSLLEIVVAVSIMLILAVVGTVGYQAYTDNARTAAMESSANQVLTSVLAADDSPGQDTGDAIAEYNGSTYDTMANIVTATGEELVVETVDKDGHTGYATIRGNYNHIETTNYTAPGVSYQWVGEPHKSESIKMVDGEEVSRNLIRSPRITNSLWEPRLNDLHLGGWEDGYGAELTRVPNADYSFSRAAARANVIGKHDAKAVTVAFDAQRVAPGGRVRVYLYNNDTKNIVRAYTDVTNERERYVLHLDDSNTDFDVEAGEEFTWDAIYLDFVENEEIAAGETYGFFDRVTVEMGHTNGEYFDGDSH